jgi:hypothetical protein
LKEAIKAHRTLAYSFGTIAGEKQLLEDFFRASVECEVIAVDANGARTYELRNNTSLPYYLNYSGDPMVLDPFCQLRTVVAKDKVLRIHVQNMWYSSTEQLVVEVK